MRLLLIFVAGGIALLFSILLSPDPENTNTFAQLDQVVDNTGLPSPVITKVYTPPAYLIKTSSSTKSPHETEATSPVQTPAPTTVPLPSILQTPVFTSTPITTLSPIPASEQSIKININTADKKELEKITGVGPVIAQRIIDYRQTNGPFQKIEDIKKVSGIGDVKFEKMKNEITI